MLKNIFVKYGAYGMINIITKSEQQTTIGDVESFFDYKISAETLDDYDIEIMKKVDNAKLIDKKLGTIKTPFGVTDITHLSTGCKTVLCYSYLFKEGQKDIIIDVTECGYNALDVLFEYVDRMKDDKSVFLLRHKQGLTKCKDRDYKINGTPERNLNKGVVLYG